MKQTAIEWLLFEIKGTKWKNANWENRKLIIEQARQMEKEQIIDAWNDGYREFYDGSSAPEEYYNQTFKSE
jgi:predicted secreted protein